MSIRKETPWSSVPDLIGGEFLRDQTYTNLRSKGTGDWLLIYTESGSGLLVTPQGKASTHAGEVVVYSPGEYQDYSTDPTKGEWHLIWVHFQARPAWLPLLSWPRGLHGVRSVHLEEGTIRNHFQFGIRKMNELSRGSLPRASQFALNALEEALLWVNVKISNEPWLGLDPRIREALDSLTLNFREPFNLHKLAKSNGLSLSRFAHLFKAQVGQSPQQFSEAQRMRRAQDLLQFTGLSISEIASEVGYDDPFYFTNRFRKASGSSPTRFRELRRTDVKSKLVRAEKNKARGL